MRWRGRLRGARPLLHRLRFVRWRSLGRRLRPEASEVLRLTAAAVLAWVIARLVTGSALDLTSALTALLVLQASTYSTVRMGLLRVGAVLAGVLVAVTFSSLAGLTWWSLAAVIGASLVLAKVLRLREQVLEVPISAMLILAVTSPDVAAQTRVVNTLVGASVGVLFNLLLPGAVPSRRAGAAVLAVADAIADCLDEASEWMAGHRLTRQVVGRWADRTRGVSSDVAEASGAVTMVKEGRKLNPRALGTQDVEPVLRSGLDRLESSLLAVRALFVVIEVEVPDEVAPVPAEVPDEVARVPGQAPVEVAPAPVEAPVEALDEEGRQAVAVVLSDVGDCVRAFGRLVRAEAEGREREAEEALETNLEILRETRAILTELLITSPGDPLGLWLLRGSILAAVEQVLRQLDLEQRAAQRVQLQEQAAAKTLVALPVLSGRRRRLRGR